MGSIRGLMRENERDMDRIFIQRTQQRDTMTVLQNMQSYEQLAETHAQHLQRHVAAFQTLYDVMPEQQRQLAIRHFTPTRNRTRSNLIAAATAERKLRQR
jgi:hypothetical protein